MDVVGGTVIMSATTAEVSCATRTPVPMASAVTFGSIASRQRAVLRSLSRHPVFPWRVIIHRAKGMPWNRTHPSVIAKPTAAAVGIAVRGSHSLPSQTTASVSVSVSVS